MSPHSVLPEEPPSTGIHDGKGVSSREPINGIHSHKRVPKVIEDLPGRCDLNSLLRDDKQYQVELRHVYVTKQRGRKSVQLPESDLLWRIAANSNVSVESFLLFIWHKVIQVFAGGENTVLLVTHRISGESSDGSGVINVLDHGASLHKTRIEAVRSIDEQNLSQSGSAVELDTVNLGHFDSHVVFHSEHNDLISLHHPISANFVVSAPGGGHLELLYADELFSESTVAGFADVFKTLLKQTLAQPSAEVADLEFIDDEQARLLDLANNTDGEYENNVRLEQLFERAVAATPEKVAVAYKDRTLTFHQLNVEANRLAHYLRRVIDVQDEQIVALVLDKNELMIASVLGIWKSGACYTPIDPTYPDARARFSLEDTGAKLILTNRWHKQRVQELSEGLPGIEILDLENILDRLRSEPDGLQQNPQLSLRSDQLCYLTYTSGTTGVPKGIKKRHTNVVNSITDLAERYEVKSGHEAVVLFSPYVFEPFARQTLIALLNSQTLVVVDDNEKLDPVGFPELMRRYGVTYLNGTASVLQEFKYDDCPDLKRLVLVGEDLTNTRYQDLRRKFKKRIINEYGFTESAFVTAVKIFEPHDERPNRSLGRPLRNVKCYVLGPNLRRLPVGAIGELYIGGRGVSDGYLHRPALTKERFLPNPYQTLDERAKGLNATIYRTGDLARWIPGTQEVEYLGRNDFQIKLRGIRIEPGEIESILAAKEGIERAVVVAKTMTDAAAGPLGKKHLVGYWTGDSSQEEDSLLTYLESRLPRYMVPTRLVNLDRIPTTINGKVDFRALPGVDIVRCQSQRRSPQTAPQATLCQIWSRLLGLPVSAIGIDDNFFRLGGNSVTCIQFVGQVRQQLHAQISVEQVFQEKTVEKLEALISKQQVINSQRWSDAEYAVAPETIGVSADVDAIYAANSLQQGFVYHYLKRDCDNDAYTMQYVCTYQSGLDVDLYQAAWAAMQQRYCCLRLRFIAETEVYQVVDSKQVLDFRYLDLYKQEKDAEAEFTSLQRRDRDERYLLDEGRLFRVHLVRIDPSQFKLLFSCHHAILDGWSIPTLLDSLHEAYTQLRDGARLATSDDMTYRASQALGAVLREQNLPYWRKKVDDITERCDLRGLVTPDIRYKTNLISYDSIQTPQERTIRLGATWRSHLRQICSERELMLHSVLQFVCHKVLNLYGSGRQSVVGTIVSGRNLPIDDIEAAVGLFINTLPLIVDHDAQREGSVEEAIRGIQDDAVAMNMRSSVDLGRLTSGKMTHELFDCLLVLENYPVLDKAKRERLTRELSCETHGTSEKLTYPLAFVCEEMEDNDVSVTLRYAAELFDEATIDDILDVFRSIFEQIPEKITSPITSLEFLGERQISRLLQWNNSNVEYPQVTLDCLFEATAASHGDKLAIAYEDSQLTYTQLNDAANRLARLIRATVQCKPDSIVALLLDKNISMFIAILAVWKAGLAYSPIDTNFPKDRIRYILEDTAAVAVLANRTYAANIRDLSSSGPAILPIEDVLEESEKYSSNNLDPITCNTDLAYIYYTSGTTGKPKGVMIEHRGVVNLQQSLSKTFGLQEQSDEVLLSFSNYTFDHFVEQMTDAFLNGQTLLILNDEMRADTDRLYRYITRYRVTYLSGTPSVISMYDYDQFDWLRRVDCVGEDFSEPVFNKIRRGFRGLIINGYGPTEVSITTHKRLYLDGERRSNKSIGFQIDNSRTYVLNKDLKRVPIGAIGELYLGGDGVGRGYQNRADLSKERFPPNPYQTEEDKSHNRDDRLYKTGDLVRWLANGEIEYLGRDDFQIKLRGQRVELGEIEAAITACTSVVQSVVVPRSRAVPGSDIAQKFLTGYFVAAEQRTEADIKAELQDKLPEHLIPNRIVQVEKLPVTASGKLDAAKLPEVDYATASEYIAPEDYAERRLCKIWSNVLGVPEDKISVIEDFFSLGGDSLLSTKLSFAVTRYFGRTVTVANLFQHRTVRSLSQFIQHKAPGASMIKYTGSLPDRIPTSLSQERLLFIDRFLGGSCAYNVLKYLQVPANTDDTALKAAIRDVVSRHPALRTLLVVDTDSKQTTQKVLDPKEALAEFELQEVCVKTLDDLTRFLDNEAQHVFNLGSQLPIRTALLRVETTGEQILAFNMHHVAIDAWSWSLFVRDLSARYECRAMLSSIVRFEQPAISYATYSIWQRQQLGSERGQALRSYWLENLAEFHTVNLPTDFVRPDDFDYCGRDLEVAIVPELLERIQETARSLQISGFPIFAAAYALLLGTFAGQDDIVMGLPVANRHHPEVEDVVGCFINMVVLRIKTISTASCRELLISVNQQLAEAQLNQEYPFEELVRELRVDYTPNRHPIVQHVFSSDIISAVSNENREADSNWALSEYKPPTGIYSSSKFDLSTTVTKTDGKTVINFNWPTALFDSTTIQEFASTYVHLLWQLVEQAKLDSPLTDLSLTSEPTTKALSADASNTSVASSSLVDMFEHWAIEKSQEIAIVCRKEKLSYQELDLQSTRLAGYLYGTGIRCDDFVGLMLEPCPEMIVSILALWKIGAAYVPLATGSQLPRARLRHILKDASISTLITHSEHAESLPGDISLEYVRLDDPMVREKVKAFPSVLPYEMASTGVYSYCIYTSGTTGLPKGVPVPQRGVIRLAQDLSTRYFGNTSQSVLMTSSYVFDFSVEQFALSFLSGNKLILLPEGVTADDEFYSYLNNEEVSYISGTPSILCRLELSRLQHLRMITSAGEALQSAQYDQMRAGFTGPINNAYGTTETTIYNLVRQFKQNDSFRNCLGDPIAGTRIYVANGNCQLLPPGAIGELYISGESVTGGYLYRPQLTTDRFITNPFIDVPEESHAAIYRTGDLVRRTREGDLEFLGRNDQQVKLRGFRVELGEVQSALVEHPAVEESAVLAKSRNDDAPGQADFLVAYYSSKDPLSPTHLKSFLEDKLPAAHVPTFMVHLPHELPTTIHGKLDTSLLPDIEPIIDAAPQAPRNDTEALLCKVWSDMLGTQISIQDDFFHRGGDSIMSLQLAQEIRRLGYTISVKDIFEHRTVAALSAQLQKSRSEAAQFIQTESGILAGSARLSPIQNWFFAKPLKCPSHWNQSFVVHTPPLDVSRLREAYKNLQQHHDAFRLAFNETDAQVSQEYLPASQNADLIEIDAETNDEDLPRKLTELQASLDITTGKVASVAYICGPQGQSTIWFALHHLITDVVSWRIIARDLQSLYEGLELSAKGTSYRQWSAALVEYSATAEEVAYWNGVALQCEQQQIDASPLPAIKKQIETTSEDAATLLRNSHASALESLLASLSQALHAWRGNVTGVTFESHGRDSFDPSLDVSNTVGWFTAMYPLILPFDSDITTQIQEMKTTLSRVPNKGQAYGALYGYSNVPRITFNYLGQLSSFTAEKDTWKVESAMTPKWGACQSELDKGANTSVLDITAWAEKDKVFITLDSRLGGSVTETLAETLQLSLRNIAQVLREDVTSQSIETPTPAPSDFIPYFRFSEPPRDGPNLFLLPPGEGGAESYFHNLVSFLPKTQLVAFNNVHLEQPEANASFEKLAQKYIRWMREVQQQGPYHLLGWSFGGVLALEICVQLIKAGDRVESLSFIDSYFDVAGASAQIGRPDDDSILDPINWHYRPDADTLSQLGEQVRHIALLKAGLMNERARNEAQEKLFEWYHESPMNGLDGWMAPKYIKKITLDGETHFTWVKNNSCVKNIASKLQSFMQDSN